MRFSVLIVDDNPADRYLAEAALRELSCVHEIFIATVAVEALTMIDDYEAKRRAAPDTFPPLVVLLDVNMPAMDGFVFVETYRNLRGDHPESSRAAIVIVTGSTSNATKTRAETEPWIDGFMIKPYTLPELKRLFADEIGPKRLAQTSGPPQSR